jgi:Tol biopolymer transport system component
LFAIWRLAAATPGILAIRPLPIAIVWVAAAAVLLHASPDRIEQVTVVAVGGRVDWSPDGSSIAFDRLGGDYLSDVWAMRSTGADRWCLTCDRAEVPQGNNGNPSWHPSGQVIAFQAQNTALPLPIPADDEELARLMTSPGWGTNHNLWIALADGSRFWQLTDIAAGMAVLHPQFDRTGSRLLWAEKIAFAGVGSEQWVLRIGTFGWQDGPTLTSIRTLAPLGPDVFYESHGFSPDSRRILFTAGRLAERDLDIYWYDLGTGALQNLTNSPGVYDEHAHLSPDGTRIVWASARDIHIPRTYFVPFLDYWTMNVDGAGAKRISYFNDPSAREYVAAGAVVADFSFSPGGTWMVSKLEVGGRETPVIELIALIR